MNSEWKVYEYPNGEIQRVQVVRLDNWKQIDFLHMKFNEGALDCFYNIYRTYLVPKCPWVFGRMILFHLPENLEVELFYETKKYGVVGDELTAASIVLQEGVKITSDGKPIFKNDKAKELWEALVKGDSVRIVCGKLPYTKVVPVGKWVGYMSEQETKAQLKCNTSFFIMDPFDCATAYDQVGMPFGLCVKDGVVEQPPLFSREALLVRQDGSVTITQLDVKELEIEIDGQKYRHGKNAKIYVRPQHAKTPGGKEKKIAIIGRKVVAIKDGGSMPIPAAGFVLCIACDNRCDVGSDVKTDESVYGVGSVTRGKDDVKTVGAADTKRVNIGDIVTYHGMEDVQFGIQVGNSIIRDGVKTEQFISRFYNIYHLERTPYPPCLFPMNFEKARAARMAIGADAEGKPILFWAEGAGKLNYVPGEDSCGASLTEMAEIATDIGMVNAINLDGGGSAQILLHNQRKLHISDRNEADNSDAERLIPLGLIVR